VRQPLQGAVNFRGREELSFFFDVHRADIVTHSASGA
jgi:hypothetical protein